MTQMHFKQKITDFYNPNLLFIHLPLTAYKQNAKCGRNRYLGCRTQSKNFEFKFLFLYAPIKPIGLERYKVSKISVFGLNVLHFET